MTDGDKLQTAIRALRAIADFGHDAHCDLKMAPVYECGCYDRSQWELADGALREIGETSDGGQD